MRNSTEFRVSTPHSPVQSVLPLFAVNEPAGVERPTGVGRPAGVQRNDANSETQRFKSESGRDPLKQARRVAKALRRGEFDVGARHAAVNSLCQYLIDSLQSSANINPH
jgi:hypothetical protein